MPGHQPRAGQLDHQPRGEPLGGERLLGVQLLLEARRRLGAQAERLRRLEHVRPDPGRGLHQHARGRLRDLGDLAAHDPGDARRSLAVADQRHRGVEARARRRRASSSSRPSRALRTTILEPRTLSRSKACIGWPVSSIT